MISPNYKTLMQQNNRRAELMVQSPHRYTLQCYSNPIIIVVIIIIMLLIHFVGCINPWRQKSHWIQRPEQVQFWKQGKQILEPENNILTVKGKNVILFHSNYLRFVSLLAVYSISYINCSFVLLNCWVEPSEKICPY